MILSEKLKNVYKDLKDMGYDLFDINCPFYQDTCIPYTSSDKTDVSLTGRINYYYNNDETICQSNCKFSDYLINSQYLKCDCDIINSDINMKESEKFNPKLIYESFYSVLKYSNYKVLKCYKLALSIKRILKNLGSILLIIYFLFFFIFFIIYIIKQKNQFNNYIINAKNFLKKGDKKIKQLEKNNIQIVNKKEKLKINSKKFNSKYIKDIDINNNSKTKINKKDNKIKRKLGKKINIGRNANKINNKKKIYNLDNKEKLDMN